MATVTSNARAFGSVRTALAMGIGLAFASIHTYADDRSLAPAGFDPWVVENCNDDGPGSLRQILRQVADEDVVDLTQLTCSTISLGTGALEIDVDDLTLTGNGVTIDASYTSGVIAHLGNGRLDASGLTLFHGYMHGSGGCIYARGSVYLDHMTVFECFAGPPAGGFGGGVYAARNIVITQSIISANTVANFGAPSVIGLHGGGVAARQSLFIDTSTFGNNAALDGSNRADAGAFWCGASATIMNSTFAENEASVAAVGHTAAASNPPVESLIANSTISYNTAGIRWAGIVSEDSVLRIENATIAFNLGGYDDPGTGVVALGPDAIVYLGSSIVANNRRADGTPDDIAWAGTGAGGVFGRGNIIIASNGFEPDDTLHVDPMLDMLADNGGPTPTHALLPGSPAIDHGFNSAGTATDQRGLPRVSGAAADIGAFEVQQAAAPDPIFADGFDASG